MSQVGISKSRIYSLIMTYSDYFLINDGLINCGIFALLSISNLSTYRSLPFFWSSCLCLSFSFMAFTWLLFRRFLYNWVMWIIVFYSFSRPRLAKSCSKTNIVGVKVGWGIALGSSVEDEGRVYTSWECHSYVYLFGFLVTANLLLREFFNRNLWCLMVQFNYNKRVYQSSSYNLSHFPYNLPHFIITNYV